MPPVTLATRLQKFDIRFPFLVAPMVGISHVAFRQWVRAYTPPSLQPLLFTEMLSTRRLPSQDIHREETLRCAIGERGFIPQLLGNEEQFIAPSIEKLLPLAPWGFDINMGCPTKKTLSHNWGVLLMGDREYAAEVVRMTKKHSPRPVSVKLRAGIGDHADLAYLDEFTRALEEAGADWLTVHCRPSERRHTGEARWDVLSDLAKRRQIPVVGNGDVQTAADALHLVQELGCDGAMIARAATARPWILWQIARRLGIDEKPTAIAADAPPETPEEEGREYFHGILRLSCLMQEHFGNTESTLKRLKYHIMQSQRWLLFGHSFWKFTQSARDLIEARDLINDYATRNPQPLSPRIRL